MAFYKNTEINQSQGRLMWQPALLLKVLSATIVPIFNINKKIGLYRSFFQRFMIDARTASPRDFERHDARFIIKYPKTGIV